MSFPHLDKSEVKMLVPRKPVERGNKFALKTTKKKRSCHSNVALSQTFVLDTRNLGGKVVRFRG